MSMVILLIIKFVDYKINLPTSSNDPLFNLLDCYLSDYVDGDYPNSVYIDPFERNSFLLDLFGNEANYLSQDLYYTSGSDCSLVESEETISFEIQSGDNQFTPFSDSEDNNLQIPINSSGFLNGTAGTTLEESDIIWQFTENCLEGAWLKASNEEFIQDTMCWRINPNNNEIRFPYPYQGSLGDGLDWTGKGLNNCFVTPYVNPELKAVNEEITSLYWADTNTTTSVESIALNETTLIDDGAFASPNYFTSDQVKIKPNRSDTTGEEVAWLYQPNNTQLSISCGNNYIYYPLFKHEEGKVFNFDINNNQVEDRNLKDLDLRKSMRGAKAGLSPDDSDQIFKLNGECGEKIEGAWLKGEEFKSDDFVWVPVTLDEVFNEENTTLSYDSGNVVMQFQTTKEGETIIEIDCGEEIETKLPDEVVDITLNILTIDDDSDYDYDVDLNSDTLSINKVSNVDLKSDETISYTLTTTGLVSDGGVLIVTESDGDETSIDIIQIIKCLREKKCCVEKLPKQNGFNTLFSTSGDGSFVWQFPTVDADEVLNGYDHDEGCEYLDIDVYDTIITSSLNNEGNQWEKCTCKAVYYSPIGNDLDNFEDLENFSDIIYEDTTDNYNLTDWRDGGIKDDDGNYITDPRDYKNSPRFGVFMRTSNVGNSNDVNFAGIGNWNTLQKDFNNDYKPFQLEKGKKYVYKRANLGGCSTQKPPCLVFNNIACLDGCQDDYPNPVWLKLVQDENGEWSEVKDVDGNDILSTMTLEANEYYNYVRQKETNYQAVVDEIGTCVTKSTPLPAFNISIQYDDMRPYWAESPTVGGLNYGLTAYSEDEKYLRNTQPKPSEMVLTDDVYVQYYRNSDTALEWRQPVNLTVDFEIPNVWKKIEFSFINPNLLRKIVGCGSCEMVFDDSPVNSCYLTQDCCNSYIANIKATDEDSDMIVRNSLDCSDDTLIFYRALNGFNITQNFTTTQISGGYNNGLYMTADRPWRNLLNGVNNSIIFDQRSGRLVNKKELGLFTPCNVGVNKMECGSSYEESEEVCST